MASLDISEHEHEKLLLAVYLGPKMFEACIGCATAGILVFMCIYGLNAYLETPKEIQSDRRLYVAISFLILILHGFGELPYTYWIFQLLYKTSDWKQVAAFRAELENTWWIHLSDWATMALVWVGDGLMVYRCYLAWTGRPIVAVLPAAIYLAAVGVSLYELITSTRGSTPWDVGPVWISLGVAVNCTVTVLILFRFLQMQRESAMIVAPFDTRLYKGAASILVESALPLALAGVLAAASMPAARVLNVQSKSIAVLFNISSVLWSDLSALAPALIIFRVVVGRSWDHDTRNTSQLSTMSFQSHISHLSEGVDIDADVERITHKQFQSLDQIYGSMRDFSKG